MRKTIKATDGHVLTNGTVYGSVIHLAEGIDAAEFREITREEYNAIMAEQQEPSEDDATEADYQASLRELGVEI